MFIGVDKDKNKFNQVPVAFIAAEAISYSGCTGIATLSSSKAS